MFDEGAKKAEVGAVTNEYAGLDKPEDGSQEGIMSEIGRLERENDELQEKINEMVDSNNPNSTKPLFDKIAKNNSRILVLGTKLSDLPPKPHFTAEELKEALAERDANEAEAAEAASSLADTEKPGIPPLTEDELDPEEQHHLNDPGTSH